MRQLTGLLIVVGLFAAPPARAADDLRAQAAEALKKYYADRLKQPFLKDPDEPEVKPAPLPWAAALKQLTTGKAEERQQAAAYLRELVALAHEHEHSKTAPWRSTPCWGGGAEIPARDLRKEVAEQLAKADALPDALPVLRWYLENETIPSHLPPIMKALGKLDGKDADTLRAEIAAKPHANAIVAAVAITQIASRKQTLPAERLSALCQHHRADIREAARKLNAQQEGKDPGPFDAAKAVRSEAVRKVMNDILALMADLPPAKAEFVEVTVRYLDGDKKVRQTRTIKGWLVRNEKDTVEVYTLYGGSRTVRNGEKEQIRLEEPTPDGRGYTITTLEATVEAGVAAANIEDVIAAVEKSRKKETARFDLSEGGVLTGQFRGSGVTLYEAILGAWLYRAGRDAEAARILLPALDSLYADRYLIDVVRDELGDIYGYRLLVAFAGDRDFAKAEQLAKQLADKFSDTRFHDTAVRLAAELPKRRDDFTKFKLPAPQKWAELKKKMSRAEQIAYLCKRFRLLDCPPGEGFFWTAQQYAEPCGMTSDAAHTLGRGKTKVINPVEVLAGDIHWGGDDRPRGLDLKVADIAQLAPYFKEDWSTLIVGYWRAFHPDRSLQQTRRVFADIINDLARRDLCRWQEFEMMSPAEQDKHIQKIIQWSRDNAHKSVAELEWNALEDEVAAGASWYSVHDRVERLLKKKESKAFEVMKRYLENEKSNAWDRAQVLHTYLEYDVTKAKDLAPKYLDAKDKSLRFSAALIVFRTGEKDKARTILGDWLATGGVGYWSADAVKALLEDGSEESRRQVARVFKNKGMQYERDGSRPIILKLCVKAGMKEPYQYYLPFLDIKEDVLQHFNEQGEKAGVSIFHPSVAEEYAREIVERFAGDDPAVKEIVKKYPKTADQIPHLKKWLQSQLPASKD